MLTSGGAVALPVKCVPKFAAIAVDPPTLDLTPRTQVVLGESTTASFHVISQGALPVTYYVHKGHDGQRDSRLECGNTIAKKPSLEMAAEEVVVERVEGEVAA